MDRGDGEQRAMLNTDKKRRFPYRKGVEFDDENVVPVA
jgi:hypothetical protein